MTWIPPAGVLVEPRHDSLHYGVDAEQAEELCRLRLLDDLLHLGETPK